jgi:hypothetical protein
MKNKVKKEIDSLQAKIFPLQNRIYELQKKEIMSVQRPRVFKLIGVCIRYSYEDTNYYGKIMDVVECKNNGVNFIIEKCSLNENGIPELTLSNDSPYLNEEWWDVEIPLSGWKKCSEEEYQTFKTKVMSEFSSQKMLRKWIKKNGY